MGTSIRKEIVKIKDIAERYCVTTRTIDNWCQNLGLCHLKIGKTKRFVIEDVDAFIKNLQK